MMSQTRRKPAFLSFGFRPFFLAAGFWAAAALAIWVGVLNGWVNPPTRFTPMAWHIHEMLFGFVMAAVAGFLLTAIPTWTSRPAVRGWRLAALAGLWALGRLVCLASSWAPAWVSIAADLAFPAVLLVVVTHEIVAARSWRNLVVVMPVTLLGIANLLMHLEAAGLAVPPGLGWRLGVIAALILISVIAGRIVPAFTRNWLAREGKPSLPAPPDRVDQAAPGLLAVGLLGWALWPDLHAPGYLLILAGLLNARRLARWRGGATSAEPLLLILHIGYAWVALGVTLLGVTLLVPWLPLSGAIHALTAGAITTMIVAVMTRVSLGHTGRPLTADGATAAIYALITLAALARVAAAWTAGASMPLLMASAWIWILGFCLFIAVYGRLLVTPRRTPG